VAIGATAVGVWSVGPGDAAPKPPKPPPFTRLIEPADPENPPTAMPAVELTAACVRSVGPGQLEAVFGYESRADHSVLVELGPDLPIPTSGEPNVILRFFDDGALAVEDLGPQVTLFKPGGDRYAFAVQFTSDEEVAWQVTLPAEDESGAWIVTVIPNLDAGCKGTVPDHFAVVQSVDQAIPQPANTVRSSPPDHIVAYDIRQELDSVRVACSGGGEPLAPKVRFGWPIGMNVGPVKVAYLVDVVLSGGTTTYEMTRANERPVVDLLQDVAWLGPIADVTAQCDFDGKIVRSDVFWAEVAGFGRWIPTVVDGLMVGIAGGQNAPLGTRLR
jgi:hypothetical protein